MLSLSQVYLKFISSLSQFTCKQNEDESPTLDLCTTDEEDSKEDNQEKKKKKPKKKLTPEEQKAEEERLKQEWIDSTQGNGPWGATKTMILNNETFENKFQVDFV